MLFGADTVLTREERRAMRKIGIGDNSGQARRLTDGAVKALPCPLAGHTITWDAVPGFGVRVTTG